MITKYFDLPALIDAAGLAEIEMYGDQEISARPISGLLGALIPVTMIGLFIFHNSDGMLFSTLLTPPDPWTAPVSYAIILAGAAMGFGLAGKLAPSDGEGTGNVWRIGIAGFVAWALYLVAGPILDRIDEAINFRAGHTSQFHSDLPIGRVYGMLIKGERMDYGATLATYGTWLDLSDQQYAAVLGWSVDRAHMLEERNTEIVGWCVSVAVQKSGNAIRTVSPKPWQIVACPAAAANALVAPSQ